MARLFVEQITGFDSFRQNLKRFDDSVTRREVLAVTRRAARPYVKAYRANLPKDQGTLQRSVGIRAVPKRKSGGNPAIAIAPRKRGNIDPFYRYMVIPKSSRPGSRKRGSRKGINVVVPRARDKTLQQFGNRATADSEKQMGAFLQKRINKLSTI